jgi:hypothetical protein
MIDNPAARPSIPSIKLNALSINTTTKIVMKYPNNGGISYNPNKPWKLLIQIPEKHKIIPDNI